MAQYYSSSSVVNMHNRDFDHRPQPPLVPPKSADSRQRVMDLNSAANIRASSASAGRSNLTFNAPPPPPSSHIKEKCNCCPYGFHIDVDFVQYAEDVDDEARKLRKAAKKRMKRSMEQFAEQQRVRRNLSADAGGERVVSVYENFSPSAGRRNNDSRLVDESGGAFSPLEVQSSLFSDSLENVMSDFDDALSTTRRSGRSEKDYGSDWETKKKFSSKTTGGRTDGYTSDCAYAVPKVANGGDMKNVGGYASSEYYAAPSLLSSVLSDSMSSLSSVNSSSLHNTTNGSLRGAEAASSSYVDDDGQRRRLLRTSQSTAKPTNGGDIGRTTKTNGNFRPAEPTSRDYYESDSGLLSPAVSRRFTTAKFYEQFKAPDEREADMVPPRRPHMYTALSGQIAENMENLAFVINRIKPPQSSPREEGSIRKIGPSATSAVDFNSLSSGSSSASSGLRAAREKMAVSLDQMKDLQDQVKSIPILNVRINNLNHEKSQLSFELEEAKRRLKDRQQQQQLSASIIKENLPISQNQIETQPANVEYRTALARAMSTISKGSERSPPEVPHRTKSVDRMREMLKTSPTAPTTVGVLRTPSGNMMNLDDFHSVRRSTGTTYRSNNGRDEDYVSDSELALGDRSTERFASLRRSRQMLRNHSSANGGYTMETSTPPPTKPPPPVPPRTRFASVGGENPSANDDYWTLSNTWVRGNQQANSHRPPIEDRATNHRPTTLGVLTSKFENGLKTEENNLHHKKVLTPSLSLSDSLSIKKPMTRDVGVNHVPTTTVSRTIAVGDNDVFGDENNATKVEEKKFRLTMSTGVNTLHELACDECTSRKKRKFSTSSTYTGPMPQPKPCSECEDVRKQLQVARVRPTTFSVGVNSNNCTCETCLLLEGKRYRSTACNTASFDEAKRNASVEANLPVDIPPCEVCSVRSQKTYIDSATLTVVPKLEANSTNTESPEIANRKVGTERIEFQSSSTLTDYATSIHASTSVDRAIINKCGFFVERSTLTQGPSVFSVGFNTDFVDIRSNNAKNDSSANTDFDIDGLLYELEHLRNSQLICRHCERDAISVDSSDKFTETDVVIERKLSVGLNTEPVKSHEEVVRKVTPTKNASSSTDKIVGKSVFVSTEKMLTTERATDCGVRTRDAITTTQRSRTTSTGTNTASPKVSRGTSDDTINLIECDSCAYSRPASRMYKSMDNVGTQSDESALMQTASSFGCLANECISLRQEFESRTFGCSDEVEAASPPDVVESSVSTTSTIFEIRKIDDGIIMTDSFLYESNDSVASKDDENVVSPLVDEEDDEFEANEKLCQLQEEFIEKENDDELKKKEKFDFKKPRATRAFALSKAAATKKLLTSESQQQKASSFSDAANNFRRNSIQSRSVRVESKNKGDPLAYITDKKQINGGSANAVSRNGGAKVLTAANCKTANGLKSKVQIKKPLNERKSVGNGMTSLKLTPPKLKSSASAPEGIAPKEVYRKSLLMDDEREEAADTLGPLPSELARSWSTGTKPALDDDVGCYDNLAASEDVFETTSPKTPQRLVSDVVENLPEGEESSEEDSSSSSGSEDSVDEGSYDTNGNITNKCDVAGQIVEQQQREAPKEDLVKFVMSDSLKEACEEMNRSLVKSHAEAPSEKLECAQQYLQHEWLKAAARKSANAHYVEEFLDAVEGYSRQLLHKVVNMCDQNENTVLHYAVSHGNFDIVSLLLDTKVCNLNRPNKAGYTPVMLAALSPIGNDTDRVVIQRLFQMGDVNIKASQHGQTALMLAVSHGKIETTKLLLEAGAGVNIQDEDGSTALMCAAEHGHKEIVRLLLSHPEIDASMTDFDGSTALSIAVDNDHKDIGVLIYAHLNYARNASSIKMQSTPIWC